MTCGRYIVGCAVLLLACGTLGLPRVPIDLMSSMALQTIDAPPPPPDEEASGYLLPRLSAKYRPSLAWGGAADPRLYILTELDDVQDGEEPMRWIKRDKPMKPSLSITNPMDILRQRLLIEISNKKNRENAIKNRELMKSVGKRSQIRSLIGDQDDKAYQTNAL